MIEKLVGSQKLQSLVVQLRKICNHPYMFNISAEDMAASKGKTKYLEKIPEIVAWSGKMLLLERLLPELLARGHKVILFSQMTRMLDIISDYLDQEKGYQYCRIDGGVCMTDRQQQVTVSLLIDT